ncbi:hypothetical protein FSP39_013055 [Pinctada imbricata]|uniref:Uncharacterized protein n=1 Tax=Pinctada imbricata TaxID=66713 RepID=A0AA89C2F3_PINIB|nr:hypothetical protein FSP39_013055 [Pinctada imbricata]
MAATMMSTFQSPVKGWPSVCTSKEGNVWLGGNQSKEIVMVDTQGRVLQRRNVPNRPHALAIMDCGDVILASVCENEKNLVSRLQADGSEQVLFDASPSTNMGVSVTADQKILICTWDGRAVRTNGDGTVVERLYNGSGDGATMYAIENIDGNIYISDMKAHAIVLVSESGGVLSTITKTIEGKDLGWPLGLAMDRKGNLLCLDGENHCVYIMDQNQKLRELVGREHGIQEPRQLDVDNHNNLWIGQFDGTVHIVKYLD